MLIDSHKTALTASDMMTVVTKINESQSISELVNEVPEVMGVTFGSYHHFASVGDFDFKNMNRYYSRNIPKALASYFNKQTHMKSDYGLLTTFKTGSFAWLSDFLENASKSSKEYEHQLMRVIDFVVDGLFIPLYGPNNRLGYMFVSFGRHKREFDLIMPHQLQSLAQRLHVRYCLLVKGLQKQVKLTNRESEVLELISFGKTNPEIAQILNISPNTVAGYVKRIFLKLESNDRVTAAMRAQSIKLAI